MKKSTLLRIIGNDHRATLSDNFSLLELELIEQFTDTVAIVMYGERLPTSEINRKLVFVRLHETVKDEIFFEDAARLGRLLVAYAFIHTQRGGADKAQMEIHVLSQIELIKESCHNIPDVLIAILLRLDIFSKNIEKAARDKIASILAFVPDPETQLELVAAEAPAL